MFSRTGRRRWSTMLGALSISLTALITLVLVSLPGSASGTAAARTASGMEARTPLVNLTLPSVFGTPIVGDILIGFPGAWISDFPVELEYQWRRCPVPDPCGDIPAATLPMYYTVPGDVGQRIQLRVTAHSAGQSDARDSEPTATVAGDRPPATAQTPTAPATAPPPATHAGRERLIDPFPIVRIRGRFTTHWTRFTLVTVRAPVGADIAMECTGRSCPFRHRRRTMPGQRLLRITGLERRFSPGTSIELRITQPGRIGKYTRISIRRGRPPARRDQCAMPESAGPISCPSSLSTVMG
jgi:hypothetical protein